MADTSGIKALQTRATSLQDQLAQASTDAQRENLQKRIDENLRKIQGRGLRNAEIDSTTAALKAQNAYSRAILNQQVGQARVGQEGDLLRNKRDLEQVYRDLIADFGGRDMTRSGVYQQQVALGEESSVLERALIVREYNNEIMGLRAQVQAGGDATRAQIAAEKARIRAAYKLAMLG